MHDSDCSTGGPCACNGTAFLGAAGNTCVPGNCRVDSDCGANGYCSPTQGNSNCGGLAGFYCHTANDLCVNDSDCTGHGTGLQICAYQMASARWECVQLLLCA
jgi:hypothetical protein